MLKASKKITKKEMQQDALITSYNNFLLFYEENKKKILYVALGVVVVAGLLGLYIYKNRANNELAATALGKIYSYYDQGSSDPNAYTLAINGIPERKVEGLKSIVDKYGSSSSGEVAKLYLGNAYYATGKIDDAMKMFEGFSSSDPALSAAAIAGEGACYESKANFEQAAAMFEKAGSMQTLSGAEYLQSAARNYGLKGDKAKALEVCKKIKKEYPKSAQARDIDRFISEYSS